MQRNAEQLKKHQEVLFELLTVFDGICKKYAVPYQLFAGTALGAVREQGFIPWDDDLDVIMLREDYKRFLEIAPSELGESCFLQKEFSEHWPMFFSKLRKNGTACIERYVPKDELTHQGIYIDIFPCDNLSGCNIYKKLQFGLSKLVIASSLGKRGYRTDSVSKKLAVGLSGFFPQKLLRRIVQNDKHGDTEFVHCFFGAASRYEKSVFPREYIEESILLPFESGVFPVSAHYDKLLTVLYGDYMTPTPEAERNIKVHAEIVDTESSYENYLYIQKAMRFDGYTRSIR